MISIKLLIYLCIGTIAMLIPVLIQSVWYRIRVVKSIILSICLTLVGTIGTYILFYIENGWIGGTSFFGAIFFVPIAFIPLSSLLKIKYSELMDICAPAECIMLSIMKVQCLLSGCCEGRVLYTNDMGQYVRFPSQLAEMANALFLCIVLLCVAFRKNNRGKVYPLYLILYGTNRFVLNIFREDWVAFDGFLPYGNIWSLVSLAIGIIALIIIKKKKKKEAQIVQ